MNAEVPIRVLLVDHRRMIRIALDAVLDGHNEFVPVGQAQSGREAIALLADAQPDIVIFPSDLAGLGAIETSTLIQQLVPEVRTVLLATVADPAVLERALLAGVGGIVTGDMSATDFIDALRRVMAGETVLPPLQVPMLLQQLRHRRMESNALMQRFMTLTRREREVLQLVIDGQNYGAIAEGLYISPHTVRRHVHNLLEKLGAQSCVEAAARCVSAGLLSSSPSVRETAV